MLSMCQLANMVTGLEARVAYPDENISSDSLSDVFTPAASTAVGLILNGFEKMAREKTIYNTATEIKYDIFADKQEQEQKEDVVTVEEANTENKKKEQDQTNIKMKLLQNQFNKKKKVSKQKKRNIQY